MVVCMSKRKSKRLMKPRLPKVLTFENVQAYKEAMRAYDLARIKAGLATPDEVQRENEAVHQSEAVELQDFPELEAVHATPI